MFDALMVKTDSIRIESQYKCDNGVICSLSALRRSLGGNE